MTTCPAAADEASRSQARPDSIEQRYRSLFVIGRGGMGRVEVALERAAEGFERIVALKRLLPEGARDLRQKEMFLREARLAALLAHPNVVHAFAFGEVAGELYLAMEYVEGETLSELLLACRRTGVALDPALAAHILAEACDGLHAAHELRDVGGHPLYVVHRDVSPHNLMIAYEGHVKILDFGVAKFDTGGHATKTGEVKGKMGYMSPEQALGEKLDRRSDLFGVGAILFECLSGRRLWGEGTDLDVMRRLALEEPPRLATVAPDAPPALAALYARLVSRDPAVRPATAQEVSAALRAFVASQGRTLDAEAVGAHMKTLFGERAEDRRALLTRRLEQAGPSLVDSRLRGAGHEALAAIWTDPVASGTARPALPSARSPTRRWMASGVIGLASLTIGGVAVTMVRSKPAVVVESNSAATATSTPSPSPSPSPSPTSTSTSTSTATATATATPTPTPTATPTPTVSPRVSFPPHRPVAPPPSPSARKLPDVDPSPF
jgi:serine/threonine-protein kinase